MNEVRRNALKTGLIGGAVLVGTFLYVSSYDEAGTSAPNHLLPFLVALSTPALWLVARAIYELIHGRLAPYPLRRDAKDR